MDETQKSACHKIIHTAAAGSAAANLIPVPGTGIAADTVALTAMVISLANVFDIENNFSEDIAKAIAINAIKQQIVKQPTQYAAKELSKFIPLLGQIVGPVLSACITEAAGWQIAYEMDRNYKHSRKPQGTVVFKSDNALTIKRIRN